MDTLISNVTVVTMNERMDILFGAYIGITEGKISYIAKQAPEEKPATILDGTGMVAMPGLVNCHTHLSSTLLRSCFDDLSSQEALENLVQKESKMDSRCAKAAATLGIAECLRFGITSVSDLSYFPEATAQAAAEAGIKANVALSAYHYEEEAAFDFQTDPQCSELRRVVQKWNGYDNGRIRTDAGLHAEYTGTPELWEGLAAYAAEQGLGIQLHLSDTAQAVDSCLERTGLEPGELLNCHGLFSVPVTAAGCTFLTPQEQALLGKKQVSAVALPVENARAGHPCASVSAWVKSGLNVALGTGGAADCGSLDMFEVMRALSCSQRIADGRSDAMPAPAILTMATVCGAAAQGRSSDTGMLKEGMDADIILVDFSAPHLIPCHDVRNALVYCAKGGDVAMTMVRGKILYQNGTFPTLDLKAAVEELTQYAIGKLFTPTE